MRKADSQPLSSDLCDLFKQANSASNTPPSPYGGHDLFSFRSLTPFPLSWPHSLVHHVKLYVKARAHNDIPVSLLSLPIEIVPSSLICALSGPKLFNMQIYTNDKTSPRSFPWLWYLRLVALVVTLIVLGITSSNTATFLDIGCNAPGRVSYNLAVVCPCPHPSAGRPLTLIPSRSSPSSLSSTSSSLRAHPAPPGFFHGSYGVS